MPPSPLWRYFYTNGTLYKTDKSHKNAWCKSCITTSVCYLRERDAGRVRAGEIAGVRSQAELEKAAVERVEPISGKPERMRVHLKNCASVPADVRTVALLSNSSSGAGATNPQRIPSTNSRLLPSSPALHIPTPSVARTLGDISVKRSKSWNEATSSGGIKSLAKSLSPSELQEEFSGDLCKLFISMNTAWSAANNPRFRSFVQKWVGPEVVVQDRRVISGRVLDREVQKVEDAVKTKVKGQLATGVCDGWKNIAKSSLVSSLMSVGNEPYLIQTHDVTGDPKTGDHLLKLVLEDIHLIETKYDVKIIAWCTDDGPDGKKIITEDVNRALDVVKWFNNHGTALELLRQEQLLTFAYAWALILPVITRWTAHYLALTRFLKLKRPLQLCWTRNETKLVVCAGTKEELQEKAREIHATVKDEAFWYRIDRIQKILEPLAIAANVSQASHTRLDHVLLTLGNLVRIYSENTEFDEDMRTGIIKSLEKRWKKADQDIFIVAVFLNPFIRSDLFKRTALRESELYIIVERVYERLMRCKATIPFLSAFEDYKRRQGEFSDEAMSLNMMKQKFADEGAPLDVQLIWARVDSGVLEGRNGLVKLAIHIFTVVANSAGCERIFSSFGITHSKLRNKIDAKRVHKMTAVGMQMKREDRDLGLSRQRRKRKFGDEDGDDISLSTSSTGTEDGTEPGPTNFSDYAAGLIQQAVISDAPDALGDTSPSIPTSSSSTSLPNEPPRQTRVPAKTQIALAALFDFTIKPEDGLEFYWPGSKKNLEDDLLAHERALADELENESVPSRSATTTEAAPSA
ncbi:ribonuclease H-like domain-containing protein [Flammula alnicola]|nr:ribonuclease H-like domain-containing protein [Flammula alnicola]